MGIHRCCFFKAFGMPMILQCLINIYVCQKLNWFYYLQIEGRDKNYLNFINYEIKFPLRRVIKQKNNESMHKSTLRNCL